MQEFDNLELWVGSTNFSPVVKLSSLTIFLGPGIVIWTQCFSKVCNRRNPIESVPRRTLVAGGYRRRGRISEIALAAGIRPIGK
jgi:hypothetical protein